MNAFANGVNPRGVCVCVCVCIIMDGKRHVIKAFFLPIIYALQQMACQYQYINLKAVALVC